MTIFHIDVNSAYLSWEAAYRLQHGSKIDLREIPAVVGGDPKKRTGIVLAKSNLAKSCGINTGESLSSALSKCGSLTIAPPNYDLYVKCSNALVELLLEYGPSVQRFSVDECFLDYTGLERIWGDPYETAEKIRHRIKSELGFTVSIGISSNKLLAKMAGELKKPDAVSTLWPDEISSKLWPLPIEELYMVGRATVPKLKKMAIYTIGDLAHTDLVYLETVLKSHGKLIWQYAWGIENSVVRPSTHLAVKGIGNSTTTPRDISDLNDINLILLSLCETVAARLRATEHCARVISVGLKSAEFSHYSHQKKLYTPTDTTKDIYEHAKDLFLETWQGEPLRHLGVRVSELCTNEFLQLNFFSDQPSHEKQRKLDSAIDALRKKYDKNCIKRACFANTSVKSMGGGVGEDEFPIMSSLL